MKSPSFLSAVQKAFGQAKPLIFNSDQGSQFTSKGRATDNIFTERLWRSLKYEEVYLYDYQSPRQARQGIEGYLHFYNNDRPHQSLKYRTPAELYHQQREVVTSPLTK